MKTIIFSALAILLISGCGKSKNDNPHEVIYQSTAGTYHTSPTVCDGTTSDIEFDASAIIHLNADGTFEGTSQSEDGCRLSTTGSYVLETDLLVIITKTEVGNDPELCAMGTGENLPYADSTKFKRVGSNIRLFIEEIGPDCYMDLIKQ